jgi:hypothetical protein
MIVPRNGARFSLLRRYSYGNASIFLRMVLKSASHVVDEGAIPLLCLLHPILPSFSSHNSLNNTNIYKSTFPGIQSPSSVFNSTNIYKPSPPPPPPPSTPSKNSLTRQKPIPPLINIPFIRPLPHSIHILTHMLAAPPRTIVCFSLEGSIGVAEDTLAEIVEAVGAVVGYFLG